MVQINLSACDEESCGAVHEATVKVLEETGVDMYDSGAREILLGAGAKVIGTRVRIPRQLVADALASAARGYSIRSRGGGAVLTMQGTVSYFGTGSDCLYVCDPETHERRRARLEDVEGMAMLAERLPNIDFVMSMASPVDVRPDWDDLSQTRAMLSGTRKPLLLAPKNGRQLAAMREMGRVCGETNSLAVYAMSTPPLMHDWEALSKVATCAELGIPLIYAPAPSAGVTAPMSLVATVVVGNAEVLSSLVLHQVVHSGAPFVYGVGVAAMDMRTALDAYVTPESFFGNQIACDLARFYELPSFSYAGFSDSKCLDEEWSAEAAISVILGALSRATLLHDVGYLESGIQSSYESIVFGDELVGFARSLLQDITIDSDSLCLDEIMAVGPGGVYLNRRYTRQHAHAFWQSRLFDHTLHGRWKSDGAKTLGDRLRQRTAELRAEPRTFELDEATQSALDDVLLEVRGIDEHGRGVKD